MKTYIYGTDLFSDLICGGKRLFLFQGFKPIEITHKIARVDVLAVDSTISMSSAITRGVLGTALFGLAGTLIGVASAKQTPIGRFKITFECTFIVNKIEVVTRDSALNNRLYALSANR